MFTARFNLLNAPSILLVLTMCIFGLKVPSELLAESPQAPLKIVFFGDSITQEGLGKDGYLTLVGQILGQKLSQQRVEIVGAGIRGDTVTDLEARLARDVISLAPEIVVIFIGVNDAAKAPANWDGGEAYAQSMRRMLSKVAQQKIRAILCTPTIISETAPLAPNFGEPPYGVRLEQLSLKVRQLARELNLPLCDLRERFSRHLLVGASSQVTAPPLTRDGVHLNRLGNQLVAEVISERLIDAVQGTLKRSAE